MAGDSYKAILERADAFFRETMRSQPQNLQCGRGCSLCCYGLFEIGSGDVPIIAEGLETMHASRRKKVIRRAPNDFRAARGMQRLQPFRDHRHVC